MCGKLNQLKVKTKIYEIMEDLIISFIRLQFFHQVYQGFRPLHISILNLNLNFTTLLFISSLIRLFHDFKPSLHKQRFLYIQSSQVQAYILVKSGGHLFTYQRFLSFSQWFDFDWVFYQDYGIGKADVCTREKS